MQPTVDATQIIYLVNMNKSLLSFLLFAILLTSCSSNKSVAVNDSFKIYPFIEKSIEPRDIPLINASLSLNDIYHIQLSPIDYNSDAILLFVYDRSYPAPFVINLKYNSNFDNDKWYIEIDKDFLLSIQDRERHSYYVSLRANNIKYKFLIQEGEEESVYYFEND